MKKAVYGLLLLGALSPFVANARIGIAPYAAITSSGIRSGVQPSLSGMQSLPAIKAGVYVQPKLSRNLYLQTGALYSAYGFKENGAGQKMRINTVEVPFYLLVKTGMPCQPRFVLGAGLAVTSQLNNNASSFASRYPNMESLRPYQKTMYGAGVSAGIEFPRGAFISVGYQRLSKQVGSPYDPGLYQYSFGVGYIINKVARK